MSTLLQSYQQNIRIDFYNKAEMILRFTNFFMIVLFALSVIVQYNDPHPIRWMLIYGAACVACVLFVVKKLNWAVAATIAAVSCGWALLKIFDLTRSGFQHMFDEIHMIQTGVTGAREFLGLFIICAWLGTLAVVIYREKSSSPHSTGQKEIFE